jgi:hypothetical protein
MTDRERNKEDTHTHWVRSSSSFNIYNNQQKKKEKRIIKF